MKLKTFQIVVLIISIAALITSFEYPFSAENRPDGFFDCIGTLYLMGTQGQGGGFFGAILAVPLIEGFGLLVSRVITICLILIITVLVTGITFSSIIIGMKDWICEMIEANKKEYKAIVTEKYLGKKYRVLFYLNNSRLTVLVGKGRKGKAYVRSFELGKKSGI